MDNLRDKIEQVIGEELSTLLDKLGCTGGCIKKEIQASEMLFITTEKIVALIKESETKNAM